MLINEEDTNMITLVDVIKHIETGRKYIIPSGDPLPSSGYRRIRESISEDEAAKYTTPKLNPKSKC